MGLFRFGSRSEETQNTKPPRWVECTHLVRVFPRVPSPTEGQSPPGLSSPAMRSRTRSTSWPRRVSPHRRLVRFVTGNKILRILKRKGLAPDLPEDIYFLIKKAVSIRKHLDRNRKDRDAKFRLILIESRIHRLARYYK